MPPPRPKKTGESTVITIKVDDDAFELRLDEINAVDSTAVRNATGMSLRGLLDAAESDPDIDVIAALVWLARRQGGEPRLAFATVAAEINYDSSFDVGRAGTVEAGEEPAADSGGTSPS